MIRSGLLGRKLGHSYSPQIHAFLGDYPYDLLEREPQQVGAFVTHGDYTGINVTIPYKKDVIPYLDALSPVARRMGAVNTIVRNADGSLFGHNTDYFGFAYMVRRSGVPVAGRKVLVLGSGGASNTCVKVLEDLGSQVVVISRQGENNYHNLHLHADAAVIVNTTPVGMYPNTGAAPLELGQFPRLEGVLDVIYNPARTKLLLEAEAMGLPNVNGLWMLVAQAKESAEYFTGKKIEDGVIEKIYNVLSAQMRNIVLIGMPGCGKSTTGALLAQRLNRELVDVDQEIVRLAGKSIPDLFSQDGESAFRDWETRALEQLGKRSALILATGGGCVTQARNYPLLHQNGTLFWLQRDWNLLPTDGRPLSQQTALADMYAAREGMYRRFADFVIDNNGAMEETLAAILAHLEGSI